MGFLIIAGLLCIVFVLSIVLTIVLIIYSNVSFKNRFTDSYGNLPQNFKLEKTSKTVRNEYVLRFPKWYAANKDGTKNKRVKNNFIQYNNSTLYLEPNFKVTCNNPLLMIKYITYLREKSGIEIAKSDYEKEKEQNNRRCINAIENAERIIDIYQKFINTPYEFENYCARIFRKEGFHASVTSKTNDGGVDIKLLSPQGKAGIVECKCYSPEESIGRPVLQKLAGANLTYKADEMYFVTTGRFSENALQYASQVGIKCIDGIKLLEMHSKHYKTKSKEIYEDDYEKWKITEHFVSPLIPPDIYNSLNNQFLHF